MRERKGRTSVQEESLFELVDGGREIVFSLEKSLGNLSKIGCLT